MNGDRWHERYFHWLGKQVGLTQNPNAKRRHWMLAEQLINTPFTWSVANDDNRVADGKDLRDEFRKQFHSSDETLSDHCSMLEMLVALCRRLEFQTSIPVDEWFWELMENIDIAQFTDEQYEYDEGVMDEVDHALRVVIDRRYEPSGMGGLFPLKKPKKDQRKVELWYQMSAYLMEDYELV